MTSPRSMKAMAVLFFTQEDLTLKDYTNIKKDFNSSDAFDKFKTRERKRIEAYIERVKEKKAQLEKEAQQEQKRLRKLAEQKRKKEEALVANQGKLKELESEMEKEQATLRAKLEAEAKEKKVAEEQRKKHWEQENNEWKEWDRERSIAFSSGGKLDSSWLSKSFYKRNRSLAELKHSVRPKIENMSLLIPKPKEYIEAHSKVRQLKDIIQLSDQSQKSLKAKQKKEMELIFKTEMNLQKKHEEQEKILKKKIDYGAQKLGLKQKKLENNLEKLEEDRQLKQKRLQFDREQKLIQIDRTQRSMEFQLKLKLEKLNNETEKYLEMKRNTERYKQMRSNFRQQLIEDIEKLRAGEVDISEIQEKYKSTLINESDIMIHSPSSRKTNDSPISSKRILMSRLELTRYSGSGHEKGGRRYIYYSTKRSA